MSNDILNISRGKIARAQKVVVYGPEGVGKSTFLSKFPGVVFIDTEGSTANMDVYRTPNPSSWTMLMQQVTALRDTPPLNGEFKTLAIDTADWAEKLCIKNVCDSHKVGGIEDFGYGKGYTYSAEGFGKLLNMLQDIVDKGINIAISAHAMMRKFEQPDEMGAYDRWELKCDKRISAMLKEWADIVIFANYETFVVSSSNKMEKKKVQGGRRMMYTTHHACWDAKNRFGLPEKLPFDFEGIAHCIPGTAEYAAQKEIVRYPEDVNAEGFKQVLDDLKTVSKPEPITAEPEAEQLRIPAPDPEDLPFTGMNNIPDFVPKELANLMQASSISLKELQHAVTYRGFYPEGTPFEVYDKDFISGVLVAAFDQVKNIILQLRAEEGEKHEY